MGRGRTHLRLTRSSADEALAAIDAGRLSPVAAEPAQDGAFALLDTPEAGIARAGRLLVETGERLILLGGDELAEQAACAPGYLCALPEGPVAAALAGLIPPLAALAPLATGRLSGHRLNLVDDHGKTVIRGDLWELATGDGAPVLLTGLTALRGYDRALARLADELDQTAAPRLADPLEAATILCDAPLPAQAAPDFVPDPGTDAFAAATGIIRAQMPRIRQVEAGIASDLDPEFLHEYRVALRRVRSVVSLFRGVYAEPETAALKSRFGALMARTGRLRDLDVYLMERAAYLALVPASRRDGIDRLFDRFTAERAGVQAEVAAWLQSDAYQQEIDALERLFAAPCALARGPAADRPAPDFARALIWKRYARVCKLAAVIEGAPDEQVHELRIHCKKLRYLMEFFAPVLGEAEVKAQIRALKKLQDTLGAFNDYAVQQASLEAAAAEAAREPGPDLVALAAGIGALVTVLAQRQAAARAQVASAFAAFDSAETRAAFRALFKPVRETA